MVSHFHFNQDLTNECLEKNSQKDISSLSELVFDESKDYDKLLLERKELHFSSSKSAITKILNDANDKRFALKEIIEQTMRSYRLGYTEVQDLDNKQFFESMLENYDRGESINAVLVEINIYRVDILSGTLDFKKTIVVDEPILTYEVECLIDLFGSCLAEREILRLFHRKYPDYYSEFNEQYNASTKRFPTMLNEPSILDISFEMPFSEEEDINNPINGVDPILNMENKERLFHFQWTGKNGVDFTRIIYAMHYAKLIDYGKGEKTNLVESLIKLFNVKKMKHWQNTLSGTLHKRSNGYDGHLEIFEQLKNGYQSYLMEMEEKDERKKK